jgi:hypothetical protein
MADSMTLRDCTPRYDQRPPGSARRQDPRALRFGQGSGAQGHRRLVRRAAVVRTSRTDPAICRDYMSRGRGHLASELGFDGDRLTGTVVGIADQNDPRCFQVAGAATGVMTLNVVPAPWVLFTTTRRLGASKPLTFRTSDQITHQINMATPITGTNVARTAPTTT